MSRLQVGDDDHPEAATKNLGDARALEQAGRLDGAAYLGGYVIESALKTLILHDRSYDSTQRAHDQTVLKSTHGKLSTKPYGHNLVVLMSAAVGSNGQAYLPAPRTLHGAAMTWSETWRYRASGAVDHAAAAEVLDEADRLHRQVILKMKKDGVL